MIHADIELVETLFRQYYRILRAYAFRLVNDADAAEDIVQDVFVALWDKRAGLHADDGIKSYLFRAVYNKSLNHLSCKKYTEEDSLECFVDQLTLSQIQENNQEDLFLAKELRAEIEKFADTLPPQVRKVFVLSRMRELRLPEIAAQMNLSQKTVEKYLTRSLIELRNYLKDKELFSLAIFFDLFRRFFF